MSMRNNNFVKISLISIFIIPFLVISVTASANINLTGETLPLEPVENFQLVSENQGWVLIANQIFWTSDNGNTWIDITPEPVNLIRSLHFIDPDNGFMVTQQLTYTQEIRFTLLITHNQGASWTESTIATYPIRDPNAAVGDISIFFLNNQVGWLVFKQASSSNFNIGRILLTTDGGETWQTSQAPLGESVFFPNEEVGYMSGGVFSHQFFRTADTGKTWDSISLSDQKIITISRPSFLTADFGWLAALTSNSNGTELQFYSTADGGSSWTSAHKFPISEQQDRTGKFANLPGEIKIITANTLHTYYLTTGQLVESNATIPNVTKIDFVTSDSAWAFSNPEECPEDSGACDSSISLVSTTNGGITWEPVVTPEITVYPSAEIPFDQITADKVDLLSRTSVFQGQGFDQCEISSLSNLQAWKNSSPLSAVNLYIGGSARGCPNENLSTPSARDFVEALSIQGWKFIPTWVGPQAACTNYSSTMSSNALTAYNQGRDQATDAIVHLTALGLSEPDGSGTVVYYDLEAFSTSLDWCLNAAKAFINGWTEKLHEEGVTAGVYGSACSSGLDEFYDLANRPDVIWPAYWRYSTPVYNSTVSPYGLPCISDSQWGDQQRIFQYTGAHMETWGNVSMYVDLDVIDGIVADISHQVGVPTTTLQNPSFETGELVPWDVQNNPADCNWQIINDPPQAQSESHLFAINNAAGEPNCTGLQQTLTHTPIFGDRYRFAIWAKSSASSNPRALTLKITGEGASPSATTQYFSGIKDQWVCLETNYDVSSGNLTGITPEIEIEDSDGIDLYLDNAHVSVNTGPICPTIPHPSNFHASNGGDQDSIIITWDPVSSASYYDLYRSLVPDTEKYFLSQTTTLNYTDSDADLWDEYQYWIRACNAGGCSPFSHVSTGRFTSHYLDFFDGFESGDTSSWTTNSQPGLLQACLDASMNGLYGLCVDSATTTGGILTYDLASASKQAQIGFKFFPNSFDPGNEIFTVLYLFDTSENTAPLVVKLRNDGSNYQIAVYGVDLNGVYNSTNWLNIPDEPSQIYLEWSATPGQTRSASSAFGGFSVWVNNTLLSSVSGIANHTFAINRLVLGGLNDNQGSTSNGVFYIDDFFYQAPFSQRP